MKPTIIIEQAPAWLEVTKTLVGFILAVVLFVVQEQVRTALSKNNARRYSVKELEHNTTVFKKLIQTAQRLKQEVALGSKQLYFDFEPSNILYKFTADAHSQGILFDRLTSQKIAKYNTDLSFFSQNLVTFVTGKINDYQDTKLQPSEIAQTFNWIEDRTGQTIETLESLLSSRQ